MASNGAMLGGPDGEIASAGADIERLVGALQDPTRRAILLSFYQDPEPKSVDAVAQLAGIHRTVAFSHLERLAALGYLTSGQRRGLPGKPAKLYRLAAGPLDLHYPPRQFMVLGRLLAESLGSLGELGVNAAHEAGRRWGSSLAAGRARTLREALAALEPLGGAYELREPDFVVSHNCVFREACSAAPHVVCGLHAGVIKGALEDAGWPCDVTPEPDSDACAYRLKKRSAGQSKR